MGYLLRMHGWKPVAASLMISALTTGCAAAAAVGLVAQVASLVTGGGGSAAGAAASAAKASTKDAASALNQAANSPVMGSCTSQLSNLPAAGGVQPAAARIPAPDTGEDDAAVAVPETEADVATAASPAAPSASPCGPRRVCLPGRATPTIVTVCERRRPDDGQAVMLVPNAGIARWGWVNEAAPDQAPKDVSTYWVSTAPTSSRP